VSEGAQIVTHGLRFASWQKTAVWDPAAGFLSFDALEAINLASFSISFQHSAFTQNQCQTLKSHRSYDNLFAWLAVETSLVGQSNSEKQLSV
jgi:hypothetical protein